MKNKIKLVVLERQVKKHNEKIFLVILLMGLFFDGFLFVNNVKAASNCICSSGGAIPGVYNKDAEYSVADSNSCKQSCMGVNNAKYYSFSDVANVGFRRLYNCLCVNGSLIPFYYPLNSKFDTSSDSECDQQCANKGTVYYSYSDLLNLGTTKVTKTPTVPVAPVTSATAQTKQFNYTLLESFPGFFTGGKEMTDLPAMILAIYKFGIWTVGIAGLFMLVVGGFMYMASAGNTSTASSARGIITDSLLGIVAALGAYLIMYVINPELTKLNLDFTPVNINSPIAMGGGGGSCVPVTKSGSACLETQLAGAFGANATKASSICKIESGGESIASTVDICQDKSSFSIGLFQINMIDSAPSICNASGDVFTTGTSKGSCVGPRDSAGICHVWSCAVKDKVKYDACVAKLKDPAVNINIAKQISNGGSSWGRWGANRTCKF